MPTWLVMFRSMSGQCWLTVYYASPTITQPWDERLRIFGEYVPKTSKTVGQRYRRWASINPTSVQGFVLAACAWVSQNGTMLGHRLQNNESAKLRKGNAKEQDFKQRSRWCPDSIGPFRTFLVSLFKISLFRITLS